jgi:hypothetical protein
MQRNLARWLLAILIGLLAASVSFAFAANMVTFGADSDLVFEEKTTTAKTRSSRRWACASSSAAACGSW